MTITKQTLNDLIAKGKTEQAMEQLLKMKSKLDKDLQEDIVMQSAKWNAYQKEKRRDTSTKEELNIARNQINQALIAIIHELPEGNIQLTNVRNNILKWAGGIAAIITFLAAVAEFSGYSLRDLFNTNERTIERQDTTAKQPQNTATTYGKNGHAIINTGDNSPVTITYGNVDSFEKGDTAKIKKDSLQ